MLGFGHIFKLWYSRWIHKLHNTCQIGRMHLMHWNGRLILINFVWFPCHPQSYITYPLFPIGLKLLTERSECDKLSIAWKPAYSWKFWTNWTWLCTFHMSLTHKSNEECLGRRDDYEWIGIHMHIDHQCLHNQMLHQEVHAHIHTSISWSHIHIHIDPPHRETHIHKHTSMSSSHICFIKQQAHLSIHTYNNRPHWTTNTPIMHQDPLPHLHQESMTNVFNLFISWFIHLSNRMR